MTIRNRIVDIRDVPARELLRNPLNFRRHPDRQRDAMVGVLEDVGNVDVLKAVETPEGLKLIDGHLRSDILADEIVKVAVLDLTEDEARRVLLTFDRITDLVEIEREQLDALLEQTIVSNAAVEKLLIDWKEELTPVFTETELENMPTPEHDAQKEWDDAGMPQFESESWRGCVAKVIVNFATEQDVAKFAELIAQDVKAKTRHQSLWFPPKERRNWFADQYESGATSEDEAPDDAPSENSTIEEP